MASTLICCLCDSGGQVVASTLGGRLCDCGGQVVASTLVYLHDQAVVQFRIMIEFKKIYIKLTWAQVDSA